MNNDIKEIRDTINYLKSYVNERLLTYTKIDKHDRAIKTLLDYITNLQEENEELKKKITFNEKSRRKMQQSLMEQIEIYKSRIDKAVEKLNSLLPICIMPNNMLIHGTEKAKIIKETLNLLNGDDE